VQSLRALASEASLPNGPSFVSSRLDGREAAEDDPAMSVTILGIAGSLRTRSYNRALLRAAQDLAPDGMTIASFELAPLPLYNADVEAAGLPGSVVALKDAIRAADGLLFATPEYNHGVPGLLKNAIDWASRAATGERPCLNGKPAGIIGASPGMTGTARAQAQLRQAFVFTQTYPLQGPEFALGSCADKFDAELRLSHERSRELLGRYLERLRDWAERLRGMA
jgi:chromate reductase